MDEYGDIESDGSNEPQGAYWFISDIFIGEYFSSQHGYLSGNLNLYGSARFAIAPLAAS